MLLIMDCPFFMHRVAVALLVVIMAPFSMMQSSAAQSTCLHTDRHLCQCIVVMSLLHETMHFEMVCCPSGYAMNVFFEQNSHQLGIVAHHIHLCFQPRMSDESRLAPHTRL